MVWHTLVKEAPLWLFERNLSKSLDRGRVDLIYAAAPRAFESFSQIAIIVKIVKDDPILKARIIKGDDLESELTNTETKPMNQNQVDCLILNVLKLSITMVGQSKNINRVHYKL